MPCQLLTITDEKSCSSLTLLLAARHTHDPKTEKTVAEIMEKVRERGDAALVEYTRAFDCPAFNLSQLKVSSNDTEKAFDQLTEEEEELIAQAIENIRAFHTAQMENSWFTTRGDGSILGQVTRPVQRAGLYVPGGQGGETPLVSTLLMTAIPAQVAGVPQVAVVSPPSKTGALNRYLLATAHMLGITEIYASGSAWSIAALGYGTESIASVDVIAGPGNIYVTTAKRLLMGKVGIDMLAGPSEILILADENACPKMIAADMLSQAEHDTMASAVCISDNMSLLKNVQKQLKEQCKLLPRAKIASESLRLWGALVHVPDIAAGIRLSNKIAPEHLEILTAEPWSILPQIENAGAIFLGKNSPEALGDYFAGPNHVLPTMGTARFSSALSVQTFCKKLSIISASKEFAREAAPKVAAMARLEGLEAHARSAELRAF